MMKLKISRKYTYQFLNTYTKNDNNKIRIKIPKNENKKKYNNVLTTVRRCRF